jgi:hypothetical protein
MPNLLIDRFSLHKGYDHKTCWVQARCGVIPRSKRHPQGLLVLTMQKLLMADVEGVSDIFADMVSLVSEDMGESWSEPEPQDGFRSRFDSRGIEHVVCDFSSQYHRYSGVLLGIGVTTTYRNKRAAEASDPQRCPYAVYRPETRSWGKVRELSLPSGAQFFRGGGGCVQWTELANGEVLLPIYHKSLDDEAYSVAVLRCAFDGEVLTLLEAGPSMSVPIQRGLVEPSLTAHGGKFWLTLRNDEGAYFCRSDDGLNFDAPKRWTFDDGEELGSRNTQQHWAQVGGRLYLVYTRSGWENDHVFRHRAPLLIAEVDADRGCLVRESEQILVPERGAGLGNFGVSQGEPGEAWVCASEWMEVTGRWDEFHWAALEAKFPSVDLDALAASPGRCALCELSGSDNRIYVVRLKAGT